MYPNNSLPYPLSPLPIFKNLVAKQHPTVEPPLYQLVSVPDPKPTPARIASSIVILEAIYAPDEVWGRNFVPIYP